jgi:DNA-binding transcriptional ArsR family regulator
LSEKEEWKEEMKKLREELSILREQLEAMREQASRRRRGIYIDIGERVRDYVEDIMEGIVEGISGELEKSVFIGPHGVAVYRKAPSVVREHLIRMDPSKVASIMSALGNEHRIRILGELMRGGKYISELLERLPEITSSTLSSHLDILQEVGLVVQEKVRGRYLITMPGRIAYKMAQRIYKLISMREQGEAP